MESTLASCAPATQCTKLWSMLQPRGPIRRDQDQQHLPQFQGYWGQKAPCRLELPAQVLPTSHTAQVGGERGEKPA